LVPGAGL